MLWGHRPTAGAPAVALHAESLHYRYKCTVQQDIRGVIVQVLHHAYARNVGKVGGRDNAQHLLSCSEFIKKDLPLSGQILTLSAALADLPAQDICLSLTSLDNTSAQSAWANHNV